MGNVLDLLTEEERKNIKLRYKYRVARQKERKAHRISPEIHMIAELGYFLGYEAIRDVRENKIDLDEVYALLEGCRKVWYSKLVESSQGSMIAFNASLAKNSKDAFTKGMKNYADRAKIDED